MKKYYIKLITFVLVIAIIINPLFGCSNRKLLKEFDERFTKEEDKLSLFKDGHSMSLFQIAFWSF